MSVNTRRALSYGIELIGTPYGYWGGEECETGAPMFAQNGGVLSKKEITSLNCAGLCNVMLRSIGKKLPICVEENSVGGTEAYFDYYSEKANDFSIHETYPMGSLLIRKFRNSDDQGHVAVLLEDGGKTARVLQSHVDGKFGKSVLPGVNASYTLEQSHHAFLDKNGKGCTYEKIVLPADWLD